MVKRKLRKMNNWLLLSTAGQTLMYLGLIIFCLAVAGVALVVGYRSDPIYRYEKEKIKLQKKQDIDQPIIMASSGLGLIGLAAISRKTFKI